MSTFTHIVVGAGSAGCVVTARIAENPKYNVLLIEAGPDYADGENSPYGLVNAKRVPMRGQTDVFDPRVDWNVQVEVPDSLPMTVPQAKVMGGGSSINGGTALRNPVADSDEWVALGNSAWSFEDVYPVYESMEEDEVRGLTGPHPIKRVTEEETGKIQRAFVEGAKQAGFKFILDHNETGAEGVGPSPVCRRGDRRISAANTFIDPIRGQSNLTILTDKTVDRVIFAGNRTIGVVLDDGQEVYAEMEVVICAGALFSPAILQRSGVGPRQVLSKLGIPQVTELPVGDHLSDHPCIPIVAKPLPGSYNADDYSLQHNARWSSSLHPGTIDLQLVCFSYLYSPAPDPRVQQGRGLGGKLSGHVAGVGCNVNKPTSLGSVAIKSRDSSEQPIVAPQYLATPHDKRIARELVRKGYQVIKSRAMQSVVGPPVDLTDDVVNSDERLDEYIQSQVTSTFHFCSTCRMASRENGGVVDQSGRVYGLQGLRVADASVIPTVPAANTMWTTMMFAERIGRSIRDGRDVSKSLQARL
jgi:choline dehydrogenase